MVCHLYGWWGDLGQHFFFVPTHPNFIDITNSQAGGKENGWTDRWIGEKKKKREKDGRKEGSSAKE